MGNSIGNWKDLDGHRRKRKTLQMDHTINNAGIETLYRQLSRNRVIKWPEQTTMLK